MKVLTGTIQRSRRLRNSACFRTNPCKFQFVERFGEVKFSGTQIDPERMESIELLRTQTRMPLPEERRKSLLSVLTTCDENCTSIETDCGRQAAKEYRMEIELGHIKTYSDASEAIVTLDKIISVQLRDRLFLTIPPDRAAVLVNLNCSGPSSVRDFRRVNTILRRRESRVTSDFEQRERLSFDLIE